MTYNTNIDIELARALIASQPATEQSEYDDETVHVSRPWLLAVNDDFAVFGTYENLGRLDTAAFNNLISTGIVRFWLATQEGVIAVPTSARSGRHLRTLLEMSVADNAERTEPLTAQQVLDGFMHGVQDSTGRAARVAKSMPEFSWTLVTDDSRSQTAMAQMDGRTFEFYVCAAVNHDDDQDDIVDVSDMLVSGPTPMTAPVTKVVEFPARRFPDHYPTPPAFKERLEARTARLASVS